jgi:hypothetical protein
MRYMAARKVLISKWCINFLGLLIFAGYGQRPQVYASPEIPDHFDSTYLEWVNGTCCPKFAAGMEKPAEHLDSAVLCFLIGCIKCFISTSRWFMRPFEVQEARLICCRLLTVVSILTIMYSTQSGLLAFRRLF